MQQTQRFPLASSAENQANIVSQLNLLTQQINALPADLRPALAETLARLRASMQAEQRQNELRMHLPLEISEIGVWDLDTATGQAWRSPRHDQIFGYDQLLPEWTFQTFLQHVLPEFRQEVDDLYQAARLAGQPWSLTTHIRRADGALRWVWVSGQPQYDEAGRTVRYTGLVQDITSFKETELALVESEARLRSLSEASFEGINISQNGLILQANEQFAHMLGYELDEVIGRPVLDFVAPQDRARVREAVQSQDEKVGEYLNLCKDGSTVPVEVHGRAIERGGRLTRVTVMRDIRAQKQAEAARLAGEAARQEVEAARLAGEVARQEAEAARLAAYERLQMVLQAAQLGTWSAEVRTGAFSADELAMRLHGFAPGDRVSSIQEANFNIHPDDRPRCEAAFQKALETGGPYEMEYRVVFPKYARRRIKPVRAVLPGVEVRWVYSHGALDPSGQRLQGIVMDITGRKLAEKSLTAKTEELEAKSEQLKESSEELQVFAEELQVNATALEEANSALLESEARLRSVLENSLDAAYRRDLRTDRYDYLSPAIEQVLGFTPAEMEAMSIDQVLEHLHPEDRDKVTLGLKDAPGLGRLRLFYRFRRPDGQYRWIADNVSTHYDETGQAIYHSGILRDITEPMQTQQALRESERSLREKETHLRLTQVAGQIGSWEWNIDSGVMVWSPETYAVLGEDYDQMPSADLWLAGVDPRDRPSAQQAIQRCLQHGSAELEYRYHAAGSDQPPRWIYSRAAMLSQVSRPGDQPVQRVMLGIHQDITMRRRTEQNAHFLADMGDLLLSLTNPREIMRRVPLELGRHLQPDWCIIDEVNLAENTVTFYPGYLRDPEDALRIPAQGLTLALDIFSPEVLMALRQGRTVVVEDSQTDLRTADYYEKTYGPNELRAFIAMPRLLNEQWMGNLVLCTHQPRAWRADEVALADSVSNLTWLAISQASTYQAWRTAEERFRLALAGKPITVFTQDAALRYAWIHNPNPTGPPLEQVLGKTDEDLLGREAAAPIIAAKRQVLQTGRPLRRELHYHFGDQDFIYDTMLEPQIDASGQVTGLTGAALDVTEQRRMEKEIMEHLTQMEVQHRLLEYREKERQELARDLHDGPIQTLVSAIFNIQFVKEAFETPALRVELDQISLAVKNAVGELREMVNELRPPSLIRFGLAKAIQVSAQDFRERHPEISLELELYDDAERLSEQLCLTLYRIYQECLNNIIRHAHAHRVMVRLIPSEGHILLEVRDDGRGFTPPSDLAAQTQNGHFGLAGMRERAEAVGGTLQIVSDPGQGAIVQATIPL